ncbi:MAG: VCBS repeat-containing protein, partial [Cyclobacteriaceae bacterium]|nr:VCBS repeat-containing protein [Cyclobacteriaceae bacterium]
MMKHTKIGFWLLLLLAPLTLAAQAPIITHMQTTAASAGEQITIYGANFQAVAGNNTVSFDGVAGTVNSATTKVLKVTVPSATAGPANVRVTTVGGSSPNITNFSIISVNMGGAFEAATFFDIGNPAREIAVGDLSGDGIVDIITTDANSTSFILTGDGDGTFTDGPNLGTNSTSTGITLADFNKDGLLDIAVTNSAISGTVSIRLNTGSNTFASPVTYAIGSFPVFVRSGDFNSDGNIDLVTSNYLGDNISLILGSGSGTFGSNTDFAVGDGPGYLAVGDFDNDNNLDVAVTNSNDDNVSILIGNGSGSFASAVNYSIGNNPQGIGVGYFNADTNLDLAVANDFDDNVGILLGAGDGTFATATHFTVSDSPKGLTVVDVNGDGLADVATSNGSAAGSTDRASVLISNGDGTFKTFKPYAAGPDPGSIASADFNNDGMMDIVVSGNHATNNISIILNDQPIVNTTTSITSIDPPFGIPGQHVTIHGSAFDNTPTNNTVTFDGVTANVIIASEFEMTVEVPLATLGTNSVVVSNSSGTSGLTNNFTVIIPNKPSSFPSFNNYTTSDSPRGAAAGDFDNDGDIDLAVPSSTGNHVQILTGNGNGTFSAGGTFAVNSSPYAV